MVAYARSMSAPAWIGFLVHICILSGAACSGLLDPAGTRITELGATQTDLGDSLGPGRRLQARLSARFRRNVTRTTIRFSASADSISTTVRKSASSKSGFPTRTIPPQTSIYILDLDMMAAEYGLPRCDLDNIGVTKVTQVPLLVGTPGAGTSPHYYTANAGPWFLYQLLQTSGVLVEDPADAQIIYVHDYCYKMWWLASVHSNLSPEQEVIPGRALLSLYAKMIESPRWQQRGGRDFVFFQSHTGFAKYETGDIYERTLCEDLGRSHHFVNVRAVRYRCRLYNESDFTIVPPAIHTDELVMHRERERRALMDTGLTRAERDAFSRRDILLFFRGSCSPVRFAWGDKAVNRGKLMRRDFRRQLAKAGDDVRVECTGDQNELKEDYGTVITHDEQVDMYFRSTFCPVISGDSQTSRRLPEAVLTGCIPVFFGPPFHTVPLADQLDYRSFALFFNLTQPSSWNEGLPVRWTLDLNERAVAPVNSEFWVPDLPNILDYTINVPNAMAMVEYLRSMDSTTIRNLQKGLREVRSKFLYMPLPGKEGMRAPTASHLLLNEMCKRADMLATEMGPP